MHNAKFHIEWMAFSELQYNASLHLWTACLHYVKALHLVGERASQGEDKEDDNYNKRTTRVVGEVILLDSKKDDSLMSSS